MRRRAVLTGSRGAKTKTVSERLNSRAIACMRLSSSPSQSSTTASGLPASAASAKTSSVWNFRRMISSCFLQFSNWLGREPVRRIDELVLRRDQSEFFLACRRRRSDETIDGGRRAREGFRCIAPLQPVMEKKRRNHVACAIDRDRRSRRAQPPSAASVGGEKVEALLRRIVKLHRGGENDGRAGGVQLAQSPARRDDGARFAAGEKFELEMVGRDDRRGRDRALAHEFGDAFAHIEAAADIAQ